MLASIRMSVARSVVRASRVAVARVNLSSAAAATAATGDAKDDAARIAAFLADVRESEKQKSRFKEWSQIATADGVSLKKLGVAPAVRRRILRKLEDTRQRNEVLTGRREVE